MIYTDFCNAKVGETFTLSTHLGVFNFVKVSDVSFMACFAAKSKEPFRFSRFTCFLTTIEAASLYDVQSRLSDECQVCM